MKTFILKTKIGEIINKIQANSLDDAHELFSIRKNLPISVLSDIYDIEQEMIIKPKKITFS